MEDELIYYRKKEELYRYVREFQLQLAKDGFIALARIDLNVHLVNGFNQFQQGYFKAYQSSFLSYDVPLPVIKIYGVDYDDVINLKKTIRHEILHFTLWLYNIPNNDDSPEFNAICKVYKAGAYEKLSKEAKEYCDLLKKLSKEDLCKKLLMGYTECVDTDESGNKVESNYYDMFKDIRNGITRVNTNIDVQKVKYEVV